MIVGYLGMISDMISFPRRITPTVEKAAFATAPASAPRGPTAAIDCFRYGEFWSLGECWKQLCENNFYIAAKPRGVLNRRACCPCCCKSQLSLAICSLLVV